MQGLMDMLTSNQNYRYLLLFQRVARMFFDAAIMVHTHTHTHALPARSLIPFSPSSRRRPQILGPCLITVVLCIIVGELYAFFWFLLPLHASAWR